MTRDGDKFLSGSSDRFRDCYRRDLCDLSIHDGRELVEYYDLFIREKNLRKLYPHFLPVR